MINWIKWNKGKFFVSIIVIVLVFSGYIFYNIISQSKDSLSSIGRAAILDKCESVTCINEIVKNTKDSELIDVLNEVKSLNKLLINQPDEIKLNGGICKILGESVGYRLGKNNSNEDIKNLLNKIDLKPSASLDNNRFMCQSSTLRGIARYLVENLNKENLEKKLSSLCETPSGVDGNYSYTFDYKSSLCSFQLTGAVVSSFYTKHNLENYSDIVKLCNNVELGNLPICLKATLSNLVLSKESIKFSIDDCKNSEANSYCEYIRGLGSTFLLKDYIISDTYNEDNFMADVCQNNNDCITGIYTGASNIYGPKICNLRFISNENLCLESFFTDRFLNLLLFNTIRGEDLLTQVCTNQMFTEVMVNVCRERYNSILNYKYKNGTL
jgi:hypothetical protein